MDDSARKRESITSFGAAADAYRESAVHREGADLETLASWSRDASRALDVACGAGHTAGALADAGVSTVVAADATPEMVRTATDEFPAVGTVADAERLPFSDGAFDAVTCRIAAHHFPVPRAFVREVSRVLAPGGILAFEDNVAPEDEELADFFDRFERLRDPTHAEAYSQSQWEELFCDVGLAIEESVTMRKELDYESWVERTDPSEDRRERLTELVRTPEAEAVYGVSVEDGVVEDETVGDEAVGDETVGDEAVEDGIVRGFGNRKCLIRAVKNET